MPHTLAAAAAGMLNEDQVRLLVRGRAAAPERYDEETDRVFSALDPKAMAVAVRQWIETASQEKPPADPKCGLWFSETLDGTWKLDATLSPEDGKLVDAALQKHLRPLMNGRRDGDPALKDTSVPQLRAQALTDLADADLRRDLPATARNNRYRINLNVRLQPDGTITPEDPVPPEAWCDATWCVTCRVVAEACPPSLEAPTPAGADRHHNHLPRLAHTHQLHRRALSIPPPICESCPAIAHAT